MTKLRSEKFRNDNLCFPGGECSLMLASGSLAYSMEVERKHEFLHGPERSGSSSACLNLSWNSYLF